MKSVSALLLVILLCISVVAAQNKQEDLRPLTPGETVQRELRGGETDRYKISLKTGQFLHITIDQRGIDVVVSLFGPDGTKLAEMNNRHINYGIEPLSFEATADGVYGVEISAADTAAPRRYSLSTDELRTATASDRLRIEAERASAEGQRLRMVNKPELYRSALERYRVTRQKWRSIDDHYWQATTLTNIGLVYSDLDENDKSLSAYNAALPLAREVKDLGCEWRILNNLGNIFKANGEKQKSLDATPVAQRE
jgi:hypothetical protein